MYFYVDDHTRVLVVIYPMPKSVETLNDSFGLKWIKIAVRQEYTG